MNTLQNKNTGGFNQANVVASVGYVTTSIVVLFPLLGSALGFVAMVLVPLVSYGAYHQIAAAIQSRKIAVRELRKYKAHKVFVYLAYVIGYPEPQQKTIIVN